VRLAPTLKTLLIFGLALRLHHHFPGPPIDYGALALGAAASWIGLPGPGEPLLIAAGLLAAKHKLDIGSVVLVAFAGAAGGGLAGWLLGLMLGRKVLEFPGPLLPMRRRILARGDEIFSRYTVLAILTAPAPMAGIHKVRTSTYLTTNFVGAAVWAASIGFGAYFIGPAIVDFVSDLGWVTSIALAVLVLLGVLAELRRRRRRAERRELSTGPGTGKQVGSG